MEFENVILTSESLPTPERVNYESLAANYRTAVLLSIFGVACILALVLTIVRFQPFVPVPSGLGVMYILLLSSIFGFAFLICLYQFLAIPLKGYCLRQHDLHFASGLIFRSVISQPMLRIQHVELKRGPIERVFGLATLQVFSAGGAYHTFQIPGLTFAKAQQLKHFILTHKDVQTDA